MLPIYVMYDSALDEIERTAIHEGLLEFQRVFPARVIINFGSEPWANGSYSSADWYLQHAERMSNQQIIADSLIRLMRNEPFQEETPHIDVMFTSVDLNTNSFHLNFCFGLTNGRFTAQSVFRYRNLPKNDRVLAIKTVLQHELGHVFGMAFDPRRTNTEEKLGNHCTNFGCIMRQGMNTTEWVNHAREARKMGRLYCPQCLADARKYAP